MAEQQKYPLAWPPGQPRTSSRTDARFSRRGDANPISGIRTLKSLTIAQAMERLRYEVDAMGISFVDDCIVSSNLKLNLSGLPRSDQGEPADPGVAVYWISKSGPRVMAIDLYNRVADNIAAVARTLEYMRGIERHGGKHIQERAFTGFAALPPPDSCWKILGLSKKDHIINRENVMAAFRDKAREGHSEGVDMARLVKARDDALKEIGAK
jgi:hypothetical protein